MKILTLLFASLTFLYMPGKDITVKPEADQNEKPLFSFGLIADVQYADADPAGTRYYRESAKKLSDAVNSLKNDSASFVINLGDLIDRDFNSFQPLLKIIGDCGIKTYHIKGNHDYSVESHLIKHLPLNESSDKGYFSFVFKNYRFIMLNGNEISTFSSDNKRKIKFAEDYIAALKNEGSRNAIEWNGGIGRKQLEWLDDELGKSKKAGEKVFLFCHYPVWPVNVHNLLNYKEVLSILEKYNNIAAWFSGHNHAGNYGILNSTHFVTLQGMVETEKTNSFAMVEVYENKIGINGYGREKSKILTLKKENF